MIRFRLIVALLVVQFAASPLWAQAPVAASPAPQASAEPAVIEAENDVSIKRGNAPYQKASVPDLIVPGNKVRTGKKSRAAVRLSDLSVMRLDQLTTFELATNSTPAEPSISLKQGAAYLFSRERGPEVKINTPAANGALRGTQLVVTVTPGLKTLLTVLEGQVDLSNAQGSVTLNSGEMGEVEVGRAPKKTAVLYAVNILQWALYYPGVLNPEELGMSAGDRRAVGASLAAYQSGDLLGALEKYPANYRPSSTAGRLYAAGVNLAVGRVDDAEQLISGVSPAAPGRRALEEMIAAVKFEAWAGEGDPTTAGEWLAHSYYLQSKSQLEAARSAAIKATEVAPNFGYAWVRVAEMQFSFGQTEKALAALEKGMELGPSNAQGHSLRGFLLSAQNKIEEARACFEQAILLDGALGNAWLGRGLTYIRAGQDAAGRQDLQVAATLEPNRSILHSYLGKAFSQLGDNVTAEKDIKRAKELDPNDPTPWLYSAIQNKQTNRYNEAITDLEKSLELNENRRVYRSQFLLDQDRAVRGVNLAAIYLNNGMVDVSVREAVRAVNSDYASASAHLFLANTYNALRDPRGTLLRFETSWFNELLLSNLLSPVGGGPLSQFVSQQEYSKLFQADGFGVSTLTDYFSTGELRETASQYGTFGNFSYSLDAEYRYNDGQRPNNEIDRLETYASFKLQVTPKDTVFFQVQYQDFQTGDLTQRYDDDEVGRETTIEVVDPNTGRRTKVVNKNVAANSFDFRETQEPGLMLLGYRHEWNPGTHTIILLGRLANDQVLTVNGTNNTLLQRDLAPGSLPEDVLRNINALPLSTPGLARSLGSLRGLGPVSQLFNLPLNQDYRASFETYSGEINHIMTLGSQTFVLGGRYQKGTFETQTVLSGLDPTLQESGLFFDPPSSQNFSVDFERLNLYAYDTWKVNHWLTLTGGVTFDRLRYPTNFRSAPINDDESLFSRTSPKAGFILTPHKSLVLRGAYTEAISGASFDESIRLEPTQVAGFNQAYRTTISEDIVGSVAGAAYRTWGLSLEQKLPTRTYWGVEYNVLMQDLDRTNGAFDLFTLGGFPIGVIPSSTRQKLTYREDNVTASINQLIGDHWSLGARYKYTNSKLRQTFVDLPPVLREGLDSTRTSVLHELNLSLLYNHPSGFFARGEARWFNQDNEGFPPNPATPNNDPRPGDEFWQLNLYAGWRFYRNQCELSCGVLNLTDNNYQLEPLNYYLELPRERTLFVRVRLSF